MEIKPNYIFVRSVFFALSPGYVTIAVLKYAYEDFEYEDMKSQTTTTLASAPVAINLFDKNGNLLPLPNANKPFEITFPIKVTIITLFTLNLLVIF